MGHFEILLNLLMLNTHLKQLYVSKSDFAVYTHSYLCFHTYEDHELITAGIRSMLQQLRSLSAWSYMCICSNHCTRSISSVTVNNGSFQSSFSCKNVTKRKITSKETTHLNYSCNTNLSPSICALHALLIFSVFSSHLLFSPDVRGEEECDRNVSWHLITDD